MILLHIVEFQSKIDGLKENQGAQINLTDCL